MKLNKNNMKYSIFLLITLICLSSCRVENKEQIKTDKKDSLKNQTKVDSVKSVYEGWTKYEIDGFGEIIIAPEMEVQKGKYKEMGEKFRKMNGLEGPQIVFQQSGLNDDESDAKSSYARVIIKTVVEKPGAYERLNNLIASKSELDETNDLMKEKLGKMMKKQGMDIVEWYPLEIKIVNGATALYSSYIRKSVSNPSNVYVKMYQFHNYDRLHMITFSYRISEKEKWSNIYDNIISSIKITEIK